jgi:hypothetical protein
VADNPGVYPRTWRRPLLFIAKRNAPGNRDEILATDRELQLGPIVSRIPRLFFDLSKGIAGSRMAPGFPTTQEDRYIPHLFWNRGTGKTTILTIQTNDGANIPATFFGNPS